MVTEKCTWLPETWRILEMSWRIHSSLNKAPKEGLQTCLFSLKVIRTLPVQWPLSPILPDHLWAIIRVTWFHGGDIAHSASSLQYVKKMRQCNFLLSISLLNCCIVIVVQCTSVYMSIKQYNTVHCTELLAQLWDYDLWVRAHSIFYLHSVMSCIRYCIINSLVTFYLSLKIIYLCISIFGCI